MTHAASSDDALVLTQDAVDTIVGAYEEFADELERVARDFRNNYSRRSWGTLRSIEQLRRGYEDLAIGEEGSAYARMREFAAEARHIAGWVRTQSQALMDTDAAIAADFERLADFAGNNPHAGEAR